MVRVHKPMTQIISLNKFHTWGYYKMKRAKVLLCMVLSLLMLVDYTVFQPAPAFGSIKEKVQSLDKKSLLIGGAVGVAAGAGIALAAPAIGGAVASAGGIAGVGSAIVGGVAAIGGGVLGAVSAFAGAIGSAIGAVGGFIAGIFTSPLFIPALVVVGACVAGYFIYKKYKEKKAKSGADAAVLPESETLTITPGDYQMSSVIPAGEEEPINVGAGCEIITIGTADSVTVSDDIPVAASPETASTKLSAAEEADASGAVTTTESRSLKAAHDRYIEAYQRYTNLVTNSGGANSNDVQAALEEYRAAYNEYETLRATGALNK